MNTRKSWLGLICPLLLVPFCWAQPAGAPAGSISVNGTAEMTKTPEVIRLHFKQYGKGNDPEAAKAALVAAEKKLMAKLAEAGAEVIVAQAGVALPSQNLLNRYRNLNNIVMQRQLAQGGPGQPEKDKLTYLERFLTIDVRPKVKTKEALALLADLQERLRKDYQELSGMADALPKDDSNDNNRVDYSMYRNDMSMYANDVRFQLAAKVTREDRVKLYGDAMKRARTMAQDLAEAAEMKVGSLQTLSSSFNTSSSVNNFGSNSRVTIATGEIAKFPFTLKDDGSEAVTVREVNINNYQGTAPEPLTYTVTLSASFKLEPAK